MLVFKQNIYDTGIDSSQDLSLAEPTPNPLRLVEGAINDDLEFFELVGRSPGQILKGDLANFFPHAHRFGSLETLKSLLKIMHRGLEDKKNWFRMNAYHFCLLYDALTRHAYNYNHDNSHEKRIAYPELKGKNLRLDLFIQKYFFDTVFLLDEDKFHALTTLNQKSLGLSCPCQFSVIHGLAPNAEEMELTLEKDYPYSISV